MIIGEMYQSTKIVFATRNINNNSPYTLANLIRIKKDTNWLCTNIIACNIDPVKDLLSFHYPYVHIVVEMTNGKQVIYLENIELVNFKRISQTINL
jgi:hypothetical protein